jgi:hypothetical protein
LPQVIVLDELWLRVRVLSVGCRHERVHVGKDHDGEGNEHGHLLPELAAV